MIDQEAIAGSRWVFDNCVDFAVVELKAKMTVRILVHCNSALERAITNNDGNVILWAFAEDLVNGVHVHAGNGDAVNLKDLIAKTKAV